MDIMRLNTKRRKMEKLKRLKRQQNFENISTWLIKIVFFLSTIYILSIIWILIEFYLLGTLFMFPISFNDYLIFFISYIFIFSSYLEIRRSKYKKSLKISLVFYLLIILDRVYNYFCIMNYVSVLEIITYYHFYFSLHLFN
jgi:hypothetical protein